MDPNVTYQMILDGIAVDDTESAADFETADDTLEFRVFIRPDGSVELATGAPDYDTDHAGYCGAGSVGDGDSLDDCRRAVAAAFDDAIETYFCQ